MQNIEMWLHPSLSDRQDSWGASAAWERDDRAYQAYCTDRSCATFVLRSSGVAQARERHRAVHPVAP
jgi:hypothetical protein